MSRSKSMSLSTSKYFSLPLATLCVLFPVASAYALSRALPVLPTALKASTCGRRWGLDFASCVRVKPCVTRAVGLRLRMSSGKGKGDEEGEDKVRRINDIQLLDDMLCQRAVQTQLTYFLEFRDGHKKQWLEEFSGMPGLLTCTTFGALTDSSDFLQRMLNAPPAEHEVAINWGNRFAGGSKDNPFIKKEPIQHTYKETVHPQKICQGIMQIREQIAEEWATDLSILEQDDAMFWDDIALLKKRQEEEGDAVAGEDKKLADDSEETESEDPEMHPAITPSWEGVSAGVRKETADEAKDKGIKIGMEGMNLIMQRVRSSNTISSPLRARNYDVLKKAMTFVVVSRLLAKLKRGEKHVYNWFSTWYEVNGDKFQTDSGQCVAEEFLAMLCAQPLRSVSTGKKSISVIDPLKIAQEILDERVALSKEWIEWLEGESVKQAHTDIMRSLAEKSFETMMNSPPPPENLDT